MTFIKGLELYGKGWKKIANLVKTRTGACTLNDMTKLVI